MVHALPKYEVYVFNMCLHAAHHAIVLAWGGISALEWAGPWLGLLGQHGPSAVLPGFALQACCKKSHKSQGCGRVVAIGPLETADWPIVFAICGPWCFVFATNATWGQMPATFSVHCPAEPCNLIRNDSKRLGQLQTISYANFCHGSKSDRATTSAPSPTL